MMDSLDAIILSKPIKIKSASSLALSSTELTESSVDLYTLWRCVLVQYTRRHARTHEKCNLFAKDKHSTISTC